MRVRLGGKVFASKGAARRWIWNAIKSHELGASIYCGSELYCVAADLYRRRFGADPTTLGVDLAWCEERERDVPALFGGHEDRPHECFGYVQIITGAKPDQHTIERWCQIPETAYRLSTFGRVWSAHTKNFLPYCRWLTKSNTRSKDKNGVMLAINGERRMFSRAKLVGQYFNLTGLESGERREPTGDLIDPWDDGLPLRDDTVRTSTQRSEQVNHDTFIQFGKHKGMRWTQVPTPYLQYIVANFKDGSWKEKAREILASRSGGATRALQLLQGGKGDAHYAAARSAETLTSWYVMSENNDEG